MLSFLTNALGENKFLNFSNCEDKGRPLSSQCGKILPERRSVVGNDDQFSLSHSQGFEGLFVAQLVFAGLHDKGQSAVDRLDGLLLLLLGSHFVVKVSKN